MRNNLHLNLVYNYMPAVTEEGQASYYRVLHFFSDAGEVSDGVVKEFYRNFPACGPDGWICFEDLDDLGKFALQVCVELSSPEVFIISAADYNLGLETCSDVRLYREIFRRYGTSIVNPENSGRKKNLFSKMFD